MNDFFLLVMTELSGRRKLLRTDTKNLPDYLVSITACVPVDVCKVAFQIEFSGSLVLNTVC